MMVKIVVLMMALLVMVGACGKKAPPVPWVSIVPKRIVDLIALPREGHLLLEWTAPKENTDKTPLIDLEGFQVLRSEGLLVEDQCRGCGERPKPVYEMKLEGKGEETGKRLSILIEDQEPGKVYVYQIVSVNQKGHLGSPSNPVWVYWDAALYPPKGIKMEQGDKRVDLSWEPVEGASGYNVYRRGKGESFSSRPLNRELLVESHFTDLSVENDRKYIYSVRTLRRVVKTDVEGKDSQEVEATPTDMIPPGSPVGLVAIPLKNGIELNWRRNQETDLFGYHVYRKRPGERDFTRLTESPLTKETYLDTHVELGQDYEYAVTSVDNSMRKNESPRSEEVKVKYFY
jgi:fibronectin type 3 domain-containing protein